MSQTKELNSETNQTCERFIKKIQLLQLIAVSLAVGILIMGIARTSTMKLNNNLIDPQKYLGKYDEEYLVEVQEDHREHEFDQDFDFDNNQLDSGGGGVKMFDKNAEDEDENEHIMGYMSDYNYNLPDQSIMKSRLNFAYTFIGMINSKQFTWKASMNDQLKLSLANIGHSRLGCVIPRVSNLPQISHMISTGLPNQFDARTRWPQCTVIGMIRAQKECGSCWAEGVAGVISDRICIDSNARFDTPISSLDLQCCRRCFHVNGGMCHGGRMDLAWGHFMNEGLVSGGNNNNQKHPGCKPFNMRLATSGERCSYQCTNWEFPVDYVDDLFMGRTAYSVKPNHIQVMIELYKHGSVLAAMQVYPDFYTYSSGVFIPTEGKPMGWLAVRLIGWGFDGEVPYWLAANSWGTDWGENGFFKINRRGNECNILSLVTAGRAYI